MRIVVAGGSETGRAALCAILHDNPALETAAFGPSLDNIVTAVKRLQPSMVALLLGDAPAEAVEAARRLMADAPRPIVLVAPRANGPAEDILSRSGALAVLDLPVDAAQRRRFLATLQAMAEVKVVRRWPRSETQIPPPLPKAASVSAGRLVAIASSTGGPGALLEIFAGLPASFPAPIVVVQHIADGFADSLVRTLGSTQLKVKLAEDGERLKPGHVYIGPDDRHFGVTRRGTVQLSNAPPIEGFRPSATFLFEAAARAFGEGLTAVVLTGMGRDGVAGLATVHGCGGTIIAQDRASSAVFGMPKAAIENGHVDFVLPLDAIAAQLAAPEGEGLSA